MNAGQEISQLRERTAYNRLALRELAKLRCLLVYNALQTPEQDKNVSLKVNEETMSVLQQALEISTARLSALESQQRLIAQGVTPDRE